MRIERIRLNDFRNYHSLDMRPAGGLCVFLGENAAGKTNILESLFFCALGRSHRTRHDGEMIRYGQAGASIDLALQKSTGAHDISCRIWKDSGREIKIDGMALSRSGELLGTLQVVMFSPEDLRLIKQGPAERRRFMDMELSQMDPAYYYTLQRYNHSLKQRNILLRDRRADGKLIASWDEQMSALGAELVRRRAGFMARLSPLAGELHGRLSGGREELRVEYAPSLCAEEESGLGEALYKALQETVEKDRERGGTSIGPHRDDILLALNGADVRAFGSQGQQRTAALSLKLSELLLVKNLGKEPPVLLLDDVLSELDEERQRMLAAAMEGCQTFLTCTQLAGLHDAGLKDMMVCHIENGGLRLE